MGRKYKSATFSLTPEQIASLETIAYSLEYRWGDRGNVSAMLKGIADGRIAVGKVSAVGNAAAVRAKLQEVCDLLRD